MDAEERSRARQYLDAELLRRRALAGLEDMHNMSQEVLRWMQERADQEMPTTRQYTITGLLTETERHQLEQALGEAVPEQCRMRRVDQGELPEGA